MSRAHTLTEVGLLVDAGATTVVIPEFERAAAIVRDVLLRLGVAAEEVATVTEASRSNEYGNHDVAVYVGRRSRPSIPRWIEERRVTLMMLQCATCKHARLFHPGGGRRRWVLRGKCDCERFKPRE